MKTNAKMLFRPMNTNIFISFVRKTQQPEKSSSMLQSLRNTHHFQFSTLRKRSFSQKRTLFNAQSKFSISRMRQLRKRLFLLRGTVKGKSLNFGGSRGFREKSIYSIQSAGIRFAVEAANKNKSN